MVILKCMPATSRRPVATRWSFSFFIDDFSWPDPPSADNTQPFSPASASQDKEVYMNMVRNDTIQEYGNDAIIPYRSDSL